VRANAISRLYWNGGAGGGGASGGAGGGGGGMASANSAKNVRDAWCAARITYVMGKNGVARVMRG
jgi:hypothetical protein